MRESLRSLSAAVGHDGPWRSVIRIFAVAMALIGLSIVFHEIWENIMCPALTLPNGDMVRAGYCAKIHLGPMMWGIALMSLGLLILQKGDVSTSLTDAARVGTVVRSWWPGGRRATDQPVVVEQPVVTEERKDDNPVSGP